MITIDRPMALIRGHRHDRKDEIIHLYDTKLSANSGSSLSTPPLSVRVVVRRCTATHTLHLYPVLARVFGQLRPVSAHPYLSEFLDGDQGIDAIIIIEDPNTFDVLPQVQSGYWETALPTFQISGFVLDASSDIAIVFIGTKDKNSRIPIYVGLDISRVAPRVKDMFRLNAPITLSATFSARNLLPSVSSISELPPTLLMFRPALLDFMRPPTPPCSSSASFDLPILLPPPFHPHKPSGVDLALPMFNAFGTFVGPFHTDEPSLQSQLSDTTSIAELLASNSEDEDQQFDRYFQSPFLREIGLQGGTRRPFEQDVDFDRYFHRDYLSSALD